MAHQKPTGRYIGGAAQKLYKLEARRNQLLEDCAKEQGRILGHDPKQFWTHSVPEMLLSVLTSWERDAAILAAQAFLEIEAQKSQGARLAIREAGVTLDGIENPQPKAA